MLCPDTEIGPVYRDYIASIETPATLILAHGYAVYAHEIAPARATHELSLLAPKAIGPKIWSLFQEARKEVRPEVGKEAREAAPEPTHRLVAGFCVSDERAPGLRAIARAMGFAPGNLVPASFEQEAIGDLLSEQGLLCGGVFTLLEWTLEAMSKAGVPVGLMREECITELELIAGLLRERGPATTYRTISQAAQCGTVVMQEALNGSNAREHFDAALAQVLDHRFAERFRSGEWIPKADALADRLAKWQKEFSR